MDTKMIIKWLKFNTKQIDLFLGSIPLLKCPQNGPKREFHNFF